MTAVTRALKTHPKANPSRIQNDICNAKVIQSGNVVTNDYLHIAKVETLNIAELPTGNLSVPLSFWLENRRAILKRGRDIAVQVAADEDPFKLASDLDNILMVVLPFVMFVDGRSYSHANNLRLRMGFKGEIRAVGDVHFDQLGFLARVGVNAFELPDNEDHNYALKAFTEFTQVYQPAADGESLCFSRRRTIN